MLREIVTALLETAESRRFFRFLSKLLMLLVALSLVILISVTAHRAYLGAPIEIWVFRIGPAEKDDKPVASDTTAAPEPPSPSSGLLLQDASFSIRLPWELYWETEESCLENARATMVDMNLRSIGDNSGAIWGNTPDGIFFIYCSGEEWTGSARIVAVSFGKSLKKQNDDLNHFVNNVPR